MSEQQQSLNQLLQWSIENSDSTRNNNATTTTTTDAPTQQRDPSRGLNSQMLAELLGGPSDADRMREAMSAIVAPLSQISLANKLIAWDNLEQLIEQIDNANNMDSMGLWPPLLQQLEHSEPEMRKNAAACCSTAVQNNVKSQEVLLGSGGVPRLARLATEDEDAGVRKKAIGALSSEVRNFQPGMDELERSLPEGVWGGKRRGVDAADMEACDGLMRALREFSAARG
ncbi:hypothetical protein M409DRAFT_24427 [Zasmidium cellare ATCC 36951]|uniref:Nucleotide exchange factor Fes1 domain-containing protein n=1 Tax=Zasmidium cellare ATCC 36951 TaxID=1080233 RepID=A0A6A6CFM2_ZASCE|nr:uncharacterized protein M409DRAFT_24427 [Zasmidium cellare ATCC 36951]KAF2165040.1 hypothetical protein M409DRAFT_24427 [Zasmidium cellare ATCC 36951]